MATRSIIVSLLAHVDHGKTSLLDKIRGSAIQAGEAGGITQAIGASIIPLHTIKKLCGPLLSSLNMDFSVPGLLFIDTPGHAAFSNLRKRGGALADIAILVVDINDGFKPQTVESLEILKNDKTPFVIALNKIDLLPGWRADPNKPLLANVNAQADSLKQAIDTKLYEVVGKVHELGFQSERFDRVDDYTKQIAIIPTSAQTGEGVPELIMVLSGLAQKFLEKNLEITVDGPAKGTILEVKEEKGLGLTVDVIVYDGTLRVNDTIVFGSLDGAKTTKVRALLEPKPLTEMRDAKGKFNHVKEVVAATGVKISAPGMEDAVAGMPLLAAGDNIEQAKKKIEQQVESLLIETDEEGIIVKADTIGALEAVIVLLRDENIPIRSASIGLITKKDIAKAESMLEKDKLQAVILGFNVETDVKESESDVKIITHKVIYKLIDDLKKWQEGKIKAMEAKELDGLVRPAKIKVLQGYVFRQSNPAVVGIEVFSGTLKSGVPLMNSAGKHISSVKSLQDKQENLKSLEIGKQAAMSLDGVTIGRQVNEGDILYTSIPEPDFIKLKKHKNLLSKGERDLLKEIASLKRDINPVWGIG